MNHDHITVSLPYFRRTQTIRAAVDSILNQTHENLTLVVVNDGLRSSKRVWGPLEDIDDPRLVRFDLGTNRGRYYIDAMVLQASDSPWFAVQDSDDVSTPDRFEKLLAAANDDSAAVFGALRSYNLDGSHRFDLIPSEQGGPVPEKIRWWAAMSAALFRSEVLKDAHLTNPTFRVSWDACMVSLIGSHFPYATIDDIVYIRQVLMDSLTVDPTTNIRSQYRRRIHKELLAGYQRINNEGIPPSEWNTVFPVAPQIQKALARDAQQLQRFLAEASLRAASDPSPSPVVAPRGEPLTSGVSQ